MEHLLRIVLRGGAVTLFVFLVLFLGFIVIFFSTEAQAQDETLHEPNLIISGGGAGLVVIILGVACVGFTIAGIAKVQKPHPWPHWRSVILALGEAAFLVGLLGSFGGLWRAMTAMSAFGAAITPSEWGGNIATALSTIILGSAGALAGLVGANLVHWLRPKPPDGRAAVFD